MKSLFAISLCAIALQASAQPLDLNDALKTASQNRASIKAAQATVDQARLHARSLGTLSPLTLGVGASSNQAIGGADDDLYISQPLDLFGKGRANRRLGEAGAEEAKTKLRAARLDLQVEVLETYFEAVAASELSQAADQLLSVAEALRLATRRRFEEGKVPEVQVTRSTIELDRAKQAASMRKANLKAALKRLAGAMGQPETQLEVNLSASLQRPTTFNLTERTDLLLLKNEVKAAEAEAGIASSSLRPDLEVRAMRSPWADSEGIYGGRIQLTWSLFDHGKSRLESQAARKKAEAAKRNYEDAELKAKAELSAVETEIESAQSQVASYLEIANLARDLVSRSQLGYSEGVGTLIDVLEATRSLREIEQERAEAKLQLNKSWIQFYQTTGTLLEAVK